jgi:hypothetical protein
LFNFLEGITNEEVTRIRCNVSYPKTPKPQIFEI